MDRLRRHFLQLGASLTGALLWPLSDASALTEAEIAERLFRVVKKPSGVDETLLTLLEATVRNHRKRFVLAKDSIYDLHTLSQDVLASLLTLTHLLEHALFAHGTPQANRCRPLCVNQFWSGHSSRLFSQHYSLRAYGVHVIYEPTTSPPKNEGPPEVILETLHRKMKQAEA